MAKTQTINLLIVEDDEIDYMGLSRALSSMKIRNPVYRVHDGIEALEALRGLNGRKKLPRPYIILLDINMPRMGGIELLEHLRADEDLKDSIVFILTTSSAEEDVSQAYAHNVAGYIVKSDARNSFIAATELLDVYWEIVTMP